MAENNKFGGFDSVVNTFLPSNSGEGNENFIDPEDIKRQMESLDESADNTDIKEDEPTETKVPETTKKSDVDSKKKEESSTTKKPDLIELDEEEEKTKDTTSESTDDETEEVEFEEESLVDAFSDIFAQELGWEFEENEKPKNIKDLVAYMQDIVETNSQPKYASDQIKELDEFVKSGGNIAEFYSKVYPTQLDVEKVDLTKDYNQKAVIRENLRNRGYSEARIDKLINRYEETATLEEEASDSLEEVKEHREKTKQELLETKKKQYADEVKQQQLFIRNVEDIIEKASEIRGLSISSKDKKELMEYIFKPEKDGLTKYQKDYNSNLKNLVESAYFTMKGDSFVQQIQKKATTDATKNLKLKIKTKGKSTKNTASDLDESNNSKVTKLWEIASRDLKSFD